MDRFDAMSVLMTVVEVGSLSAASRRLGIPLATVSRRVSELEAHLKTRLLNRSSRQVSLTEAGRSYVVTCKRILEQLDEAERTAAGEYSAPRGELTLTAPVVFGRLHVLPIAMEFLEAHPDIDLRLVLADRTVHLVEESVDAAIRIGALPDSGLIATRLGAIRRVICGSPAYFKRRGTPRRPEQLRDHDCITFEGMAAPHAWSFPAGKKEKTVPVHSRLTVNTAEAAVDAALAGVGVTRVLSYQIAEARRAGTLAVVLESFEPAPWPIHLVHVGGGLLPLKLRAFLDWATPRLKARLLYSASSVAPPC